jgi:glucose-6-phosphate 1-dehydrogenase
MDEPNAGTRGPAPANPSDRGRDRSSQPAARPAGPRIPRVAGPVRHGDVRRHRRPGPQEADAGLYDLANRGLLPPGFSLVGFARRDWEDEDFAQVTYEAVKEHARTPFRETVWQQLRRASGSCRASSTTTRRSTSSPTVRQEA